MQILDNGIPIYYFPSNAETIAIGIGIKIGSIYEEKDKRGISHFVEHMTFKSNTKYNKNQILDILKTYSFYNGYTSLAHTIYVFDH